MSRRPRVTEDILVDRALAAMAPGGSIWSESPIRRAYGQVIVPRMGGGPTTPNPISKMYLSGDHFIAGYGNGQVYPLPPASQAITLDTTYLNTRDYVGLPMCAVIGSVEWKDLTPPDGWTLAIKQNPATYRECAVWTLDAWDGHSFVGSAVPFRTPGLSGALYSLGSVLLVGDGAGRWVPEVGGVGLGNQWVASDPGWGQGVQVMESNTRYDRIPAPWSLGYSYGGQYHGMDLNFHSGEWTGGEWWQDPEILEQPFHDGTFTAGDGSATVNINIRWAPR